ncbi:MAG: radical SAM protein [Proteobacteria bacterium]|nr:radical SAM protein [Pseudomonadota bacterium]
MKVLLAYLCRYQDRHDYFLSRMPVGLVSIAACAEKEGHEVTLANFSSSGRRKTLRQIAAIQPGVIGFSLFTHNRIDTLKLVQEIRKAVPGAVIVLGGPHATFLAEEIIRRCPAVNYIIQGEGEGPFAKLLKNIAAGKKPVGKIISAEIVDNLDDLPAPGQFSGKLIGVKPADQFHFIITSRGCPCSCVFCSSPAFWQRMVRYRSPGSIFHEIQYLYKKYGIQYFSIRDDNFTMNKKRVLEFCRQLRESGLYIMWNCQARVDAIDEEMLIAMKQAGLEHIQYGVESGSAKILKRYDKHIALEDIQRAAALTRRVGVYLSIYLMAGMEGETRDDIDRTKELITKILPTDGIVSPVALYPGTLLYEQAKKKKMCSDAVWFSKKDAGIFLRTDEQAKKWMADLLLELERIQKKSAYREADFARHREVAGAGCWITDILEGDYYFNRKQHRNAEKCYRRVITEYPQNPWGHLRMDTLK